jgi:hypothetical protein
MKKLSLIIPIALLILPIKLYADYGCLIPGYPELLTYQSLPPGGIFSNSPATYPDPNCQWILDTSQPYTGCIGHAQAGIKGTYYQECPIDDNIASFFIFTAIIVFFKIKRKALFANK